MKQLEHLVLICSFIMGMLPPALAQKPVPATRGSSDSSAQSLRTELEQIFSDRRFADAQWGVEVFSLDRSEILYEKNSLQLYIPASNNKILTAAAALIGLGPNYRIETHVLADGPIENGILKGNLIVRGFGDPSNSVTFQEGNPFGIFVEWAEKLKEWNIHSITGDILGDTGAFDSIQFGQGWQWDDLGQSYAAPVSALQFNDNTVSIEITPGTQRGTLASIQTFPLSSYLSVENKVVTEKEGTPAQIRVEPGASSESIIIRGSVPVAGPAITRAVSVQSPVRYYLSALKHTLSEQGIGVETCGIRETRNHKPASLSPLWTHYSVELSEILKPLMKASQNLYAETLTRALGFALRGEGTFDKGKEIVEETLSLMGIEKESYAYADASGLSRLNLVSADTLVRVLRYMHRDKSFPSFYGAMSIAGVDGTLETRLKGTKVEGNLHAKTGTLAKVSAISGYLKTSDGEMLAFSMMANNFLLHKDVAESLQNRAILLLANFSRKGPP